jgi:hypothetical protein
MSPINPLDRQVPPVGEEIHLPGPTVQPLLLTVGITTLLVGVTTTPVLIVAGAILSVAVIVRWISDTRHDIAELPLEHHHP